jgi:DNA polymerase/3'-5' exonuclease PolX
MAKTLDASEVAALLVELSRRTGLVGGNPYRARAYARAAESLATLTVPLATVVEEGRLRAIPGIGETIAVRATIRRSKSCGMKCRRASSTCSPFPDCGRRK